MAIIAPQTGRTFCIGDYWRILKGELIVNTGELVPHWWIQVGFYASEAARWANPNPMEIRGVAITLAIAAASGVVLAAGADPRAYLYELLMLDPLFANTNATGDVQPAEESPTE